MKTDIIFLIILVLVSIHAICIFLTLRIVVARKYELRKWIFYAFFFNIFALFFLIFKRKTNSKIEDPKL